MIVPGRKYTIRIISACRRTCCRCARWRFCGVPRMDRVRPAVERARAMLARWDGVLARDSAAAAPLSDPAAEEAADCRAGGGARPSNPQLKQAIARLSASQGSDWAGWRWGRMHTRAFPHPYRGIQSADCRAAGRSRHGRRRRRQLPRDHGRRGLGSVDSHEPPASPASRAVRSMAACCLCGWRTRTFPLVLEQGRREDNLAQRDADAGR